MGVLDSSFLFLPFGNDLLVVSLVARHHQGFIVYVLLAATGSRDAIDASVVLTARERRHWVVTSDPDDLHRLDPDLPVIAV